MGQVQKGNYGQPAPAAAPAAATPAPSSYQAAAAPVSQAITDKDAALRAEQERLLAERAGFVSSQESLPALYARLLQEAGVPQLQSQLEPVRQETLTTEEQLRKLAGDVGTLTVGQGEGRRRLVEAGRRAPLIETLGDLARTQERFAGQISSATQGVGQQAELYGEQFKRSLSNYDTALSAFGERAARESSNFTKAKELELEAVFAQIKRAEDLSDQEAEKAFTLLRDQQNYQRELSLKSSGGSKGPSAQETAQGKFDDTFQNVLAAAGTDPARAQKAVYDFLKGGGSAKAKSLGLDAEDYWAVWRSLSLAADPNSRVR